MELMAGGNGLLDESYEDDNEYQRDEFDHVTDNKLRRYLRDIRSNVGNQSLLCFEKSIKKILCFSNDEYGLCPSDSIKNSIYVVLFWSGFVLYEYCIDLNSELLHIIAFWLNCMGVFYVLVKVNIWLEIDYKTWKLLCWYENRNVICCIKCCRCCCHYGCHGTYDCCVGLYDVIGTIVMIPAFWLPLFIVKQMCKLLLRVCQLIFSCC